jgi:hypothetical protein
MYFPVRSRKNGLSQYRFESCRSPVDRRWSQHAPPWAQAFIRLSDSGALTNGKESGIAHFTPVNKQATCNRGVPRVPYFRRIQSGKQAREVQYRRGSGSRTSGLAAHFLFRTWSPVFLQSAVRIPTGAKRTDVLAGKIDRARYLFPPRENQLFLLRDWNFRLIKNGI